MDITKSGVWVPQIEGVVCRDELGSAERWTNGQLGKEKARRKSVEIIPAAGT
jgi:hypothetical protein